jgi:hydroxyacylglutathione hydrolase
MNQVTEGVYLIQGQDEMIPDAHVYLIGKPSSKDLSLVDVGLVGKGTYKLRSLTDAGIELSSVKRIIMTHTHLDHIGCLSEIIKAIPGAELWIHTLEAVPLEDGDDRPVYGMQMFKQMCQMQYRLTDTAFKFKVHRKLEDGDSLQIGDMKWEVVHIPGHSMGGIALYNSEEKILIPGDVVYADYAIGRFDLHGADAAELKKSLMKLAGMEVNILLPGHNRTVTNVAKGYILQTAKQWASYLE